AFVKHGVARKPRREGTGVDHAERAEAAKTYLASRMSERVTLDEVARAVHVSPFHLARIFQQQTGVPVHRYLTQLRLRASLERLAAGASDPIGSRAGGACFAVSSGADLSTTDWRAGSSLSDAAPFARVPGTTSRGRERSDRKSRGRCMFRRFIWRGSFNNRLACRFIAI